MQCIGAKCDTKTWFVSQIYYELFVRRIIPAGLFSAYGKYIGKKVGKSMSLTDKIIELCSYDDEQEWFEFKENWFQPEELSTLPSRADRTAAQCGTL